MEKIFQTSFPDVVFGSSEPALSKAISRAVKAKQLKKIAARLYTTHLSEKSKVIVTRYCYQILEGLFPGAVLSHRSALEGKPTESGEIFLTYKYTKNVKLPGLTVRLIKGAGPLKGDTLFMDKLYLASRPRAFLENMQRSRRRSGTPKTLSTKEIEVRLEKLCQIHGDKELHHLRDEARILSKKMHLTQAFKNLDKMIGGLLGTQRHRLKTPQGRARTKGEAYDPHRIELFAALAAALQTVPQPRIRIKKLSGSFLRNLAFFEAYFSNYIEGTEFLVEEAEAIIFENKVIPHRQEDMHDILGTYDIVSNANQMRRVPVRFEMLVQLLQQRHATLLGGRPDKTPGVFKETLNRAGNTVFVAPELVMGTLKKGFTLYKTLAPGFSRAAFMMFLISEIHPFTDGNGRIARVMMNAELDAARESRIIIPTVYREDYLLTLRTLSRDKDPHFYLKMLAKAQAFTTKINFSDLDQAHFTLKKCNAFLQPDEGKLRVVS